MERKIYVLIGPKGSGKSFIGSIMERCCNIIFFRVEDIWQSLRNEKNYLSENDYFRNIDNFCREGNLILINEIRRLLQSNKSIVIESLGITPHFPSFLDNLQLMAEVFLIKIVADLNVCLERVKMRDQSIHIPISDDTIKEINKRVHQLTMDYSFEIINNDLDEEDIIAQLKERM
ncbi:MAG TPA: hypothetical protein PK544_15185 [Spirochaetota bacterium]|nr:hypothetical protein [Spirochaetota bacterium]HPQ54679.1 hypothetical protein [Spirochaetota bacterium]